MSSVAVNKLTNLEQILATHTEDILTYVNQLSIINYNLEKKDPNKNITLFAQLRDNTEDGGEEPIVLKVSFALNKGKLSTGEEFNYLTDNTFQIERQIYKAVISNLKNNNHTPHLISYIGESKDYDLATFQQLFRDRSVDASMSDYLDNTLLKVIDESYNKNLVNILYLSQGGEFLLDFINIGNKLQFRFQNQEKDNLTESEISKIQDEYSEFLQDLQIVIFQVLYTLRCFELVGLSHNDLHFNNIFIKTLRKPVTRIYHINDHEYVKIKSRILIEIYDFDRASIYHPNVDRNLDLDKGFCQHYQQCSSFNKVRDLASFISSLQYLNNMDPLIANYIKGNTSNYFRKSINDLEDKSLHVSNIAWDLNDIHSINTWIKKLVVLDDECFKVLEYGSDEVKEAYEADLLVAKTRIYKLPLQREFETWMPTSTKEHLSMKAILETDPKLLNTFTNKHLAISYVKLLYSRFEVTLFNQQNQYIKEFDLFDAKYYVAKIAKYYVDTLESNCCKLFYAFLAIKPVSSNLHIDYITVCYMLSIPFVYKYNSLDIVYFFYDSRLFRTLKPSLGFVKYAEIMDDIWNVFNGKLPIRMLKL